MEKEKNIIIDQEDEVVTVENDFDVETEEGEDGITIACVVIQCK